MRRSPHHPFPTRRPFPDSSPPAGRITIRASPVGLDVPEHQHSCSEDTEPDPPAQGVGAATLATVWAGRQRQRDGVATLPARSCPRENHPGTRKPGVRPAAASLTSAVNVGPNFSGDAGDRCHLRRSSTRGGDLGVDSNTPTNRPASQPAGTKTAALKHHQPNTDTAALAIMASANCRCRPASLPTRARPSSSASTGCGCRESAWPPGSGAADASVVTVLRSGVFRRWTGIVALIGAVASSSRS